MSERYQNQYYSFNHGNAHFVTVNLDFYNDTTDANKQYIQQWLTDDLNTANSTRDKFP